MTLENDTSWRNELRWIKQNTPYTRLALERFPRLPHCRLTVRFHIDLKMVPVIAGLSEKISLQVFPCHEDTTHKLGWRHLANSTTADMQETWQAQKCEQHLGQGQGYLCDLGGELIAWALDQSIPVKAALEGTTSGLHKIRGICKNQTPRFPILNWNDARLKREIHNEKMVGFSLWQTFTQVTQLSLHGKSVGVLGFGPVGRGIARTARSLGGRVLVYDPNPESCVTARFEGFECPGRHGLLSKSEVLVTATGQSNVLRVQDLFHMPDGALLLNAGHSEEEWDVSIREHESRHSLIPHLESLSVDGSKSVTILARGRLLNLSAGFGDTINAFDLTSAQLVDALSTLMDEGLDREPGLQAVPKDFFQLSSDAVSSPTERSS